MSLTQVTNQQLREPIILFDSTCTDNGDEGLSHHVPLLSRIATKTFDAIHRSHVFTSRWQDREVILKAWEVSHTDNGKEMWKMYVRGFFASMGDSSPDSVCDLYQNENLAFQTMSTSGFVPAILFDGYMPRQHELSLETRVLITELRRGQRLRTCWETLVPEERADVEEALMKFFRQALTLGIYHDDLLHLRNCLWDRNRKELTVLDFELVGVQWKGPFTEDHIERVAKHEVSMIMAAANDMKL